MGIKEFIYKRVLFPKSIILNNPGIITNNVNNTLGPNLKPLRFVYSFRKPFLDLYITTTKALGEKATYHLFYKLGKDAIALSTYLANVNPPNEFYSKLFLKFILLSTKSTGIDLEKLHSFNYQTKTLIIKGKNSFWPHKKILNGFLAGIMSAYASLVFKQNIEAKYIKQTIKETKIKCSPKISYKYKSPPEIFFDKKIYTNSNFIKNPPKHIKARSFQDLVNHKKIKSNKDLIFYFKKEPLFPSPIINDLITYRYKKINRLDILKQSLTKSAYSLAQKILESKTPKQQLEELKTILCAFGWGFPYHEITKNKLIITILHPPYTKFGFDFYAYELNGYLNYIFKKDFKIEKIEIKLNPVIMKIHYTIG